MKLSRDSKSLIVVGCIIAIPVIIGVASSAGYDVSFIPFADKIFPSSKYVDPCEQHPCFGADDLQREFPPGHQSGDMPESMKTWTK